MTIEISPREHELLLDECRRLLASPLAAERIFDQAAQWRMANVIARVAEERERRHS